MKAACGGPQRRPKNGQRLSRFVFTLNNYTPEEYAWLTETFAPSVKWMIIGMETGENETPHLQGACILGTQTPFSKLKTLLGFKRAHIEVMRGTPEDSRIYCSKQDSHPFESGTLPGPGKRTDIASAVCRIQAGESLKDLARDESGGIAITKFHKGLTVLRSMVRPPRDGKPFVFWIHGPTGVGKTRIAFKCARALLRLRNISDQDCWISSGGLRWFDGYDGHTAVILDDFRAKHVTSFAFFLRLLDRYPMAVEFKGGFVAWTPSFIFITSPKSPKECFAKRGEFIPEDIAQLDRRICESFEIDEPLSSKSSRKTFVSDLSNMVVGK